MSLPRLSWPAGATLAFAAAATGGTLLIVSGTRAGESSGVLGTTTISGYTFDAVRGTALADSVISTAPPTDTLRTNGEGLFVLGAGQAFGRLSVRAEQPGFRQVSAVCVELTTGGNTLADLHLVRADPPDPAGCTAACDAGEECVKGLCVTRCNPPCACDETCSGSGTCEPSPASSPCGANATWLGGALCTCEPGHVPSGDGRSCVVPGTASTCPEGAVTTPLGCECAAGLIPDPAGETCVAPEDTIVSRPGSATLAAQWTTPGVEPWALAHDGTHAWLTDRGTGRLYQLALTRGAAAATVVASHDLGGRSASLKDLAAANGSLYLAGERLERFDPATGTFTDLTPSAVGDYDGRLHSGISSDGALLHTSSTDGVYQRSLDGVRQGGAAPWASFPPPSGPGDVDFASHVVGGGVAFLAFGRGSVHAFRGTRFDGSRFTAEFVAAAGESLQVTLPGSHVLGFELAGLHAWIIVGGAGLAQPVVAEVDLGG